MFYHFSLSFQGTKSRRFFTVPKFWKVDEDLNAHENQNGKNVSLLTKDN